MSRPIQDIILATGGLADLSLLVVKPPGQLALLIEKEEGAVRVTLGGRATARFSPDVPLGCRGLSLIEGEWPKSIDAHLRQHGYVEAAIHHYLKSTQPVSKK